MPIINYFAIIQQLLMDCYQRPLDILLLLPVIRNYQTYQSCL
jgi:hypothetical protein